MLVLPPTSIGVNIKRRQSLSASKKTILTDATARPSLAAIAALFCNLSSPPVESTGAGTSCFVVRRDPSNFDAFRFALGSSDGNAAYREAQIVLLGVNDIDIGRKELARGKRYDATVWAAFTAQACPSSTTGALQLATDHEILVGAALPNASSRFTWCDRYADVIDCSPGGVSSQPGQASSAQNNVPAWFMTPGFNFEYWVVFVTCAKVAGGASNAQGVVGEFMQL